jgi:hypothetical protein
MPIGYKYAERDADSQVNWAEVGKGLSDMLAETNRVREEKKDALDTAQREAMNYVAETPNGEHVGARESMLEYSDQVSNRLRIADQLLKSGQMSPKDYTIFRQNIIDNTNLAFNANKVYQEKYSDVMQGVRDKKYSQLMADNFSEAEGFGNWGNIGWEISPNGTVMAGKMVEQEVDGKKVRTLDRTPGGLRSMNYLNQAMTAQIDFYNYEDKVNGWVDELGKEKTTMVVLGKVQQQGYIKSKDDITSREDIVDADKEIMFKFLDAEDDQIATIVGNPLDASRVLVDSAIFAPNNKQYSITTSEEEAKANPEKILKVVDPDTGGFSYVISKQQQEDANEFVRGQMRAKYNYEEEAQVVGQVSRDEESEGARKAKEGDKKAATAASMIGKLYYGNDVEVGSAIDYLKGLKDDKGVIIFQDVIRDGETGVTVTLADGTTEKISFLDADGNVRTLEDFIRSAGPLLVGQLDVNTALEKGSYEKGKQFNRQSKGRGTTIKPYTAPADAFNLDSNEAAVAIRATIPEDFEVIDATPNLGDKIRVVSPTGAVFESETEIGERAGKAGLDLQDFVNAELEKIKTQKINAGASIPKDTTAAGGKTR